MDKYLEEISDIFLENNFIDLIGAVKEKQLLFLYAFYRYSLGDPDSILDVIEHCPYNATNNNFIQGVFENLDSGSKVVDILSVYYVNADETFDFRQIKYILTEIESRLLQMNNHFHSGEANDKLLLELWDNNACEPVNIKILTNYRPTDEEKADLKLKMDSLKPREDYISFDVVYADDIVEEIENITSPKDFVNSDYVVLESGNPNNLLTYGSEKSLICNVKASSIKELYRRYHKSGLFSMNLRFYIADKKVDPGLQASICNKGDQFWYLNNGIIFICDDYIIKNDKVFLTNFSIINGGQTTRMIGETPFAQDFVIMCKIVKNKYGKNTSEENKKRLSFISDIAQASNTQKPINSADLIANKVEQRLLKDQLSREGIFMQIKRGDIPSNPKVNFPEPWQKTKNVEIAQYIYAGIYQKPGTARSAVDKLCTEGKKYSTIFGKEYSSDLLKSLLFIKAAYKKWQKFVKDSDSANDMAVTKKNLVANGTMFMTAMVVLIAKLYYAPELVKKVEEAYSTEEKQWDLCSNPTFDHAIFEGPFADTLDSIFKLFEQIYNLYYSQAFNNVRLIKPDYAFSNFTKTDTNYFNYAFKNIVKDFIYNPAVLRKIAREVFHVETPEEHAKTVELVEYYSDEKNFLPQEDENEYSVIDEKLDEMLTEFRTKTYMAENIKAYNVFTNAEKKLLVKYKPKNITEIYQFGCFKNKPKTKTRLYGFEICKIINAICYGKSGQ